MSRSWSKNRIAKLNLQKKTAFAKWLRDIYEGIKKATE